MLPPRKIPNESEERRAAWLEDAAASFVASSAANKAIFSVILEALWPEGHGIPGPILTEDEIRNAVDAFQLARSGKPYKDVFRRVRELQGEEGFTSIRKEGTKYQLQSLEKSQKREPRIKLPKKTFQSIRENYSYRCASCGAQEPDVKLSPDHKIPRSRNGSNDTGNIQPLCEQCNNIKSNTCRGCSLNCHVCSWAFPEDYKLITISDDNKELVRREAVNAKTSQSDLVNRILREHFLKHKH